MSSWSYFYSDFHVFREVVEKFDLYHQTDNLGHWTVRNGRGIKNIYVFVICDGYTIKTNHSELLKGQGIFRVIDVSDKLEDF